MHEGNPDTLHKQRKHQLKTAKLMQECRRLREEVVKVSSEERQRIAEQLHDTISQEVYAIRVWAEVLKGRLKAGLSLQADEIERIIEIARTVHTELHQVASGILLPDVRYASSREAFTDLSREISNRYKLRCTVVYDPACEQVDPKSRAQFYFIAREAVHNAVKHARASEISVCLKWAAGILTLEVSDDGIGMNKDAREGVGLRIMKRRAELIGARLHIDSGEGGTSVKCSVEIGQKI